MIDDEDTREERAAPGPAFGEAPTARFVAPTFDFSAEAAAFDAARAELSPLESADTTTRAASDGSDVFADGVERTTAGVRDDDEPTNVDGAAARRPSVRFAVHVARLARLRASLLRAARALDERGDDADAAAVREAVEVVDRLVADSDR